MKLYVVWSIKEMKCEYSRHENTFLTMGEAEAYIAAEKSRRADATLVYEEMEIW